MYLPASSGSFPSFEHPNRIESLFLRERINGDGTGWTKSDYRYTLNCHIWTLS
jgi:hypothetical protein